MQSGMGDSTTPGIVMSSRTPGLVISSSIPDITASMKRLKAELSDMAICPPPLCSAGLQHDNLYQWVATILGPPNSVYEGGIFKLSIKFAKNYPFTPPKVNFLTRIYHCNVSSKGHICLDILHGKWTPALTVSTILLSICSLLTDCNPADPLTPSIAVLYIKDREKHDRIARDMTRKYASDS